MRKIVHKSEDRGHANHGWLNAKHSFSFAQWYNPDKVQFGALRVLNDDIVQAGMGFGTHPHDNMEIITIPLSGSLAHKDSMGNGSTIQAGEVQVMSAGTGIQHSEFNASNSELLNLFQIWIFPNKGNVVPRYDQISYNLDDQKGSFVQVVSPNQDDAGTWIHQDAWIHLGKFDQGKIEYPLKGGSHGVYVMVVEGSADIDGVSLGKRDAVGLWETDKIEINTSDATTLMVIEVPIK